MILRRLVSLVALAVASAIAGGSIPPRGPAVAKFGATRIGDMVTVAFDERLSFVLSDRKTPDVSGVSASQAVGIWWVVGVNPTANTIALVNPASGPVRTYNATTQVGRDQLSRVTVGDSPTAINDQVLVVSITPKA